MAEVVEIGVQRGLEEAQLLVGELDRVHGASLTLVSESLRARDVGVSRPEQAACGYQREAIVKDSLHSQGSLVLAALLGVIARQARGSDDVSSAQTATVPVHEPIKQTKGSSPARLTGDGRYFGYVRAVDATSDPRTIGFDVAQFFFGKNVQEAAEEDGAVRPGEAVSNDHYERNRTRRDPRTLPAGAGCCR